MRLGYLLIYLMASMLPFGKSIIAVVLALLIVYDIAVYFKPRKIWGKAIVSYSENTQGKGWTCYSDYCGSIHVGFCLL